MFLQTEGSTSTSEPLSRTFEATVSLTRQIFVLFLLVSDLELEYELCVLHIYSVEVKLKGLAAHFPIQYGLITVAIFQDNRAAVVQRCDQGQYVRNGAWRRLC
jgi:hypothetical protein